MSRVFSDRRKVARYAVHVPIKVVQIGTGSTIDLSASGVAFLIESLLEPGAEIRFGLALEDSQVLLYCHGRVVRAEKRGTMHFAAATIDNLAVKTAIEH